MCAFMCVSRSIQYLLCMCAFICVSRSIQYSHCMCAFICVCRSIQQSVRELRPEIIISVFFSAVLSSSENLDWTGQQALGGPACPSALELTDRPPYHNFKCRCWGWQLRSLCLLSDQTSSPAAHIFKTKKSK